MTLDEQIEYIEKDLHKFLENSEWLSAIRARNTIIELKALKDEIDFANNGIDTTVWAPGQ